MEQPKAPENKFGCFDCELPTYQDEVLFWLAIVSPFVLTVVVSFYFVRRARKPFGFLQDLSFSVSGGLVPAIGVAISADGSVADKVGLALVLVLIWATTLGPLMVFFTQWAYVEFRAIRQRFEK